jgi:hypothetical protein
MSYTLEEIYRLAGREDKVAILTFHSNSTSYKYYGENMTIVFHYNKPEREILEKKFQENVVEKTFGNVKMRYFGDKISSSKIEQLFKEGINSIDIQEIFPSTWSSNNLFYNEEKRSIATIEIPLRREPKGGDYDWMYGFKKKLVREGTQLFPYDIESYLGWKYFYEPNNLTGDEKSLVFENGVMTESIEIHFLELKVDKEIATSFEKQRFEELSIKRMNSNLEILKKELNDAGTNLSKLAVSKPYLCDHLLSGTFLFIPQQVNGFEGKPIFLDWHGYLHIFIRHVDEFSINDAFDNKDKFLWHPKDVVTIIKKVIESFDNEIQDFWKTNPDSRFSKYGEQSLYFEGDYYTFHIEAEGRISTFHRSKKSI